MKYSKNYNLKKPDGNDNAKISDINENMDVLDEEIAKKANKQSSLQKWNESAIYDAQSMCYHKGEVWTNTSGDSTQGVEPGTNYNIWNVGYSNPNLLDNPWFTVNSRGVISWSNWSYGPDRWKVNSGTATINSDGSVTLSPGTMLMNRFSGNPFVGKVMTASMLLTSGKIVSTTGTVIRSDTWTKISETNDGDEHTIRINTEEGGDFNISLDSLDVATMNLNVRAVKLEFGTVSTLANDVPPNYSTELFKCITSMDNKDDSFSNKPVNMASNPNLLDNPWFTINQRGITLWTNGLYGVDRWKLFEGKAEYSNGLVKFSRGDYSYGLLAQPIEASMLEKLHGSTLTFSVKFSDYTIIRRL